MVWILWRSESCAAHEQLLARPQVKQAVSISSMSGDTAPMGPSDDSPSASVDDTPWTPGDNTPETSECADAPMIPALDFPVISGDDFALIYLRRCYSGDSRKMCSRAAG